MDYTTNVTVATKNNSTIVQRPKSTYREHSQTGTLNVSVQGGMAMFVMQHKGDESGHPAFVQAVIGEEAAGELIDALLRIYSTLGTRSQA